MADIPVDPVPQLRKTTTASSTNSASSQGSKQNGSALNVPQSQGRSTAFSDADTEAVESNASNSIRNVNEKPLPQKMTLTIETVANEPPRAAEVYPSTPCLEDIEKFRHHRKSIDVDNYFVGPREFDRHSKWPMALRLHGSVLPKMIVPMLFVGGWASAVAAIHQLHHPLGLSNVLLTVLGFVVGLALSFRNATAYERYAEGRKYWQTLSQTADVLGRTIWMHVHEREETSVEDLLNKISALNMIAAFAYALMHKLRFEPYIDYSDLFGLVGHLNTLARSATRIEANREGPPLNKRRRIRAKIIQAVRQYGGGYLGLPFAEQNPRATIKKAISPVGNLPLEILNYLSTYIDHIITDGLLPTSGFQVHAANSMLGFHEVLAGCERIINTPLPLAYSIAISQITWLYIMVLPFQLVEPLGWLSIPGTLVAGYIILGMQLIGQEVENPFGNDVNDLPLEQFCSLISQNLDIIATHKSGQAPSEFMDVPDNQVFYPVSSSGYKDWKLRKEDDLHRTLEMKTMIGVQNEKLPLHTPDMTATNTPAQTHTKPTPESTFNIV